MKIYLSIFLFLFSNFFYSQNHDSWYEKLMIRDIVYELSDDKFEGRQTGEKGGERAGDYIYNYLNKIFKNHNNVNIYTQDFEFSISKNPHQKSNSGIKKNARNIICFIDNKSEETIIIGAHYDHLGYGAFGSRELNKTNLIHNGADDNASGVAMGISLINILYDSNKYYNYLFIAFDGEEMGLYGSSFFCKNPTINLEDVRFMINFDMVGKLNQNKDLAINGVGTSSKWKTLINNTNDNNYFSLKFSESGIGPSDHTSFYLQNIPSIHFFTGQHDDYHKPSDKRNKLNYDGIFDVLCFVESIINSSVSIDNFDFKETKNETKQTPKFSVTLGVMPDYLYSGKGMRIDGVSKGKTADKFGILKGDVVIKMGSIDVTDMISYMQGLSEYKKGDEAIIKVLRGSEEINITVIFQ